MEKTLFREFKPTIYFLAKFIALYLVGNLTYGVYVNRFTPKADPITFFVTEQSGLALTYCGWPMEVRAHESKPNALLVHNNSPALQVYEGCNGVNIMIIFAAFLFAFGPVGKKMLWFMLFGILAIHVMNLLRIGLLFFVAEYRPDFMYFVHKYLLTAILYLAVFLLWFVWVTRLTAKGRP